MDHLADSKVISKLAEFAALMDPVMSLLNAFRGVTRRRPTAHIVVGLFENCLETLGANVPMICA